MPRGTVAVLLSRFPLITETFILREICEMERQGQPVRLVPLIEEDPDVVHPEAEPWIRRALNTGWLTPEILASNLRRLRAAPGRYLRVLWEQVRGALGDWGFLVRTVALFPKAVHLAERLQREGVRHLHAHFATHPTTVARIIGSLTGIGYSFTAHAHDIFVRRQMLGDKLRDARFVRVISRYNRDYLRALYPDLPVDKLQVIPVGIDVDAYAAGAVPARSGAGAAPIPAPPDSGAGGPSGRAARSRDGRPRLLCVAALKPYKGIPVLLEACRRLRDDGVELRCDLVGDGPMRDEVEAMVDELALGDAVRLLGPRPQEEVARLLAEATALVLPSVVAPDGQMEGVPVVLMEAMASGCPVVSSRISGIPELVRDGVDGMLTEPGDAAAVAAAVRRILADPVEARRMARNARVAVGVRHRLDETVASLLRELESHVARDDGDGRLLTGWERLHGSRVGVRRVRDRADSRVLEIIASDGRRVRELVVKVQRSRAGQSRPPAARAAREFAVLKRCRDSGLGVPTPVELDRKRGAILMSRCSGECLVARLRDVRRRVGREHWQGLDADLRATGHWLRELQRLASFVPSADIAGAGSPPAADSMLALASARVEACRRAGLLAPGKEATVEWLRMLQGSFRPQSTRPVLRHGDFWPGNVFVDDGSIEVIDFEGADVGYPWQDVGYFLVHMELYFAHPLVRRRGARLAEAFVDGLGGRLDEAALRFSRIFVALELLAREAGRRSAAEEDRSGLRRRHLRALRRIVLED